MVELEGIQPSEKGSSLPLPAELVAPKSKGTLGVSTTGVSCDSGRLFTLGALFIDLSKRLFLRIGYVAIGSDPVVDPHNCVVREF